MKKKFAIFQTFKHDLSSSLVVFLVALPLCLGVALGSQVPLFSGLIAGIIGGIVIGFLSGSHLSVSGPAAGLITIVAAAVLKLPSLESFFLAVVIAGCLQILFGYLKAGMLGDYVPSSVIKGMLAAIGLLLILKQLPHLAGYDADFDGDESFQQSDHNNTFSALMISLGSITPLALGIGIISLILQIFWEKLQSGKTPFFKWMPAPLLVVILGVSMNALATLWYPSYAIKVEHLVQIPIADSPEAFFSFFRFPDWSQWLNPDVWFIAITIALVASLETLLSIEAIDNLDPYKRVTPTNQELKAQGVGNLLSGFLGGLPVTSVIVRSSANVNAGGRSKVSTILHGILLLVSVSLLPELMNLIPKTSLAAILIFTGYKLAKPSLFKAYYKKGWDQFVPFVVTIGAILLTDLLKGVAIGFIVGLFYVMRSNFRSAIFVAQDGHHYLFRLKKDVSFLNKPLLKSKLERVPDNSFVLIDTSAADFIDKDVIGVIEDFMQHASLKNISLEIKSSTQHDFFAEDNIPTKTKGSYIKVKGAETNSSI